MQVVMQPVNKLHIGTTMNQGKFAPLPSRKHTAPPDECGDGGALFSESWLHRLLNKRHKLIVLNL
ncbi:Uncharacterised protein [uncultured archaeon]|nr:Uncharacterised protein [uncultured archaeon]